MALDKQSAKKFPKASGLGTWFPPIHKVWP